MPEELRIPVVQEEVQLLKRQVQTERVSVRTVPEEEQVLIRGDVWREHIEVGRVAVEREVAEAPQVRVEGDVTIIPIFEERLVIEKRLFLVEEIHLRRQSGTVPVEMPATIRRTRVEVEREDLHQQEERR